MDYELAKKLKDAGYTQNGFFWLTLDNSGGLHIWTIDKKPNNAIVMPSLEELIEACKRWKATYTEDALIGREITGIYLKLVEVDPDKWEAGHSFLDYDGEPNIEKVYGKTPTEAVANLWLELNK